MARAEIVMVSGGALHDYRIDQGKVTASRNGTVQLLERDGTVRRSRLRRGVEIWANGQLSTMIAVPLRVNAITHSRRRSACDGRADHRVARRSRDAPGCRTARQRPCGRHGARRRGRGVDRDDRPDVSRRATATASSGCAPVRRRWPSSRATRSGSSCSTSGCPGIDGFEVCRRIRAQSACRSSCSRRATRSPTASPGSSSAPTTTCRSRSRLGSSSPA